MTAQLILEIRYRIWKGLAHLRCGWTAITGESLLYTGRSSHEKLISILKERSAAQPAYMRRFTDNHPLKLAAWVPYFDHMDAIIFLAPIRCAFGVKLDYFNSQS